MPASRIACVVLAVVPAVCGICLAEAGRGRHKRLFAVPCPGKVAIDGRLDDWDLSGQILIYVVQETSETQSARFALMYDAEALYIGAVVRDPTPMLNRHDPRVDGDKGWDADACQFRIVLDPAQGYPVNQSSFEPVDNDQMAHLTLWYYADRNEPCLQMHYGMGYKLPRAGYAPHGVVPRGKFEAVYARAEDGRGYTFEYRIPWTTLEARRPPTAGDLVAGTVQFNWGAPDGLKTAGGSAWAYDVMSGPGFPFQSSGCWGKIVFAEKGNVPREMVAEGLPPARRLPLTFEYDLPEDGEATVALFDARGVCIRNLVAQGARRAGRNVERWDGLDGAGKPLPPGSYAWRGLIHQPLKTRFILSVHNSGRPPYKTDDNTGGWGGDHGTPTDVCAVGQDVVMAWDACESGWGIIRTDGGGRKKWGSKHSATYLASDGRRIFAAGDQGFEKAPGVRVFDAADCRPLNFAGGCPVLVPPGAEGDARGPKRGGKHDEVTGLAFSRGTVYVSFRTRDLIALYDAHDGTLRQTWAAPSPGRLAVRPDGRVLAVGRDAVLSLAADGKAATFIRDHLDEPAGIAVDAAGTIYLANRGKRQDVSVFSPDGRYLRSIGRPGGRPRVGTYRDDGILEPGGIAVDSAGRLWVAETLDSPKRISVWDPATGRLISEFFGGSAYSTFAWMDPQKPDEVYCHNVAWKIDLDKGTWRPQSTCWRPADVNSPPSIGGGFFESLRVLTARNGRQYGWAFRHAIGPVLLIRDGDVFRPLVHFIRCIDWHSLTPWPPYPLMRDKKRFPMGQYVWTDANNDQVIQADELKYLGGKADGLAFHWVDAELNLWSGGGWVHRPVRVEPDGRPVYDFDKPQAIPVRASNGHGPLVVDPDDGSLYTNSPSHDPGLARWTPDGRMLWGYRGTVEWPQAVNLPPVTPGKLYGPTCPLGVAGEFTGIATYFGPFHLFTRDGLYVAMVFRDGRQSGLGADIIACESFSGQLVRPKGMDRYFLLAGDQDGRITEIIGLETVKRLPGGTYTLTEKDARAAADALAEYESRRARAERLTIVRGRPALDSAPPVGKTVGDHRSFAARAAYDAANLYIAFDVDSPHELINAATDPKIIFKGGNLLDLQLAADPQADPRRSAPAPGDVRVLVTRQDGRTVAVVYRPKIRGFAGTPIVLESPTGRESFDAIEPTDRVKLEYRRRAGGFRAVAAIPLDLLGWTPRPGATVRMDLGFIFGNATGTRAAMRAYWTNNSFTANIVDDVPHESRLEPHEWGSALVE